MVPEKLREASTKVHGPNQTRSVKLRTFLSWFGAKRRGAQVSVEIRSALKKVRLVTEPDFMTANIKDRIRLKPYSPHLQKLTNAEKNDAGARTAKTLDTKDAASETDSIIKLSDPTPRLGTIFGMQRPVSVTRNDKLTKALTIMVNHDFSQLPVMNGTRHVDGIISWKTIGDAALLHRKKCEFVKDCMDKDVAILPYDSPLPRAIKTIADNDIVLVKDSNNEITGIVTHYDLAERYHTLSEPFLLLAEIEMNLRQLIVRAGFPQSVLEAAKDPKDTERTVKNVSNLTFGEYVRLLDNTENWKSIHLNLSRSAFISEMKRIREIRNEVMHFSPDPLDKESLAALRRGAQMMRKFKLFDVKKDTD